VSRLKRGPAYGTALPTIIPTELGAEVAFVATL